MAFSKKNNDPVFRKKRSMQHVHFDSVEEFLEYLPEDELKIVEKLREIIWQAIPDCVEKLAYNVPFYKVHSNICFVWPPSVPWGNMHQKGVRLGFSKGYLLHDKSGYLDKGDRKQVYCKDFYTLKDIEPDILLSLLHEAALLDKQSAIEKKTSDRLLKRKSGKGKSVRGN